MPKIPTDMLTPIKIAGYTNVYGREEDGHIPIYVREEPFDEDYVYLITQWRPTKEQIKQLQEGASIILGIQAVAGAAQPPVQIVVTNIQSAGENDNG